MKTYLIAFRIVDKSYFKLYFLSTNLVMINKKITQFFGIGHAPYSKLESLLIGQWSRNYCNRSCIIEIIL